MAETTAIKYITLENMSLFKDLMMDKVSAEDAKSIKTVALSSDGRKLLFYKVSEPVGSTAPAYEIELPQQDLSNLLEKFNGATSENIVIVNSDGKTIADSGINVNSLASKEQLNQVDAKANANKAAIDAINDSDTGILAQAKADASAKAKVVQDDLDALKTKVGDIPAGATATTVIGYVDEKAADATSAISDVGDRVTQTEKDIAAVKADYLKAADKTELEGKIQTAQDKADAAQTHSEGVADDLAKAKQALEAVDSAHDTRIGDLEKKIVGLSGAMHFVGIKDSVPTDVSGYAEGDVIIVGEKEFVFNGTEFAEFGDVTAQSQAISALTGRMDTAEGEIDTLQTEMDAVEAAVATKAEAQALDNEVKARTDADKALSDRLDVVEEQLGGEGSVAAQIEAAKQAAIAAAATDATTKANQALADAKTYTDDKIGNVGESKGTVTERLNAIELELDAAQDFEPVTADEIRALFA